MSTYFLQKVYLLNTIVLAIAACGQETSSESSSIAEGVEDNEWLPGGEGTNTLLLGENAFTMPAQNITSEHESHFYTGNSFFNQAWVQAPSSTESRDGLGPLYNARSCDSCHFKDGRGRPPLEEDEEFVGLLLRLSIPGLGDHGEPIPDENYGGQLQPFSIADVPVEGVPHVEYVEIEDTYEDGEPYTLLQPVYTIDNLSYGNMDEQILVSPRAAPSVIGLGLLESISLSRLQELEDPDDVNGDGISGKVAWVWDVEAQAQAVGRFGWKAEKPTVRQQSAGAFLGDIGITSSLFSDQECSEAQTECQEAITGGDPEIADNLLERVVLYAELLAVPVREEWDDEEVLQGKQLFHESGCSGCHVASHQTEEREDRPELSNQLIWPYTDLLLHDMGEELSDQRPVFEADGNEWRTAPLWGVGRIETVNGHNRLLHDGRARGVAEAILWHGGEAESSKELFRKMNSTDRQALVRFVESL